MTHLRHGPIRALLVGAASLILVLAGPVTASHAHDELVDSEPADGVELPAAPEEILLEFSGEVAPVGTFVIIEGPLGEVTDGEPAVDGTEVTQPTLVDVPPGEYSVTWRVTSSDGHPISGEFGYSIAAAGPEAQGEATEESDGPTEGDGSDEGDDSAAGETAPDGAESTDSNASPPEDDAEQTEADRAADTAAAPASGDSTGDSGTAWWVWGVLALAVITLGGLGAVAVRRR